MAMRELNEREILSVAGGDEDRYYVDEEGSLIREVWSDDGHFKSLHVMVAAGSTYTSVSFGWEGAVGSLTHVWGGDNYAGIGVGTPGFNVEGGHTANADLSGPNISIGVPIGPGQLTMDPITGGQMGYTNGFGQVSASAQYMFNLNNGYAAVVDGFNSMSNYPGEVSNGFIHQFYGQYEHYDPSAPSYTPIP